MAIFAKQIIYGCESRGDGNSPYMTRYAFPRLGPIRPALHIFHRSDADELHDHPWPFVSIILWRGYVEETASKVWAEWDRKPGHGPVFQGQVEADRRSGRTSRKRVWPGMVLFRRATHVHRVELINGKKAVTLVFFGPRIREWGFFTSRGWQQWKSYFTERGC